MKLKLLLASVLLCLAAQAQTTFINHRLNFVGGSASTTLTIGTNVLATVENFYAGNLASLTMTIQFAGGPAMPFDLTQPANDPRKQPILGPATITLSAQGTGGIAYFLLKYEAVNATLPAQGVVVQPAGTGANIALQTSTDLASWAPATNGVYSASGQNRFFRMSLTRQ